MCDEMKCADGDAHHGASMAIGAEAQWPVALTLITIRLSVAMCMPFYHSPMRQNVN